MNVWTASWLSAALFSALGILAVKFFETDPKGTLISATFSAIILACILIAEGENRDRQNRR